MTCCLVLALPLIASPFPRGPAPGPTTERRQVERPLEARAEVVRVIDGDTLEVQLQGELVTLRLLSVDTEEKISGRPNASPTKPQTVFGEETALWTRQLFDALGADEPVQVGLVFPEGRRTDAFGRLLAHVQLPDGRDLNLLLVSQGKSPYFNKYGNSLLAHAAFVRAQESARAAGIGIWDPATNRARTEAAPSVERPYGRLLPWWDARAAAIDAFRSRDSHERNGSPRSPPPGPTLLAAEDPAALQIAFERCKSAPALRVTVFASIERFYEERDGSLTALLRSGDARTALRAAVDADERAELEPWLRASTEEFRQNYLYATGRMERNPRGFVLTGAGREDWRLAEPAYPSPPR